MTTTTKKPARLGDFLAEQGQGASRLLARHLGVGDSAIAYAINTGIKKERAKKRYADAFNKVFGTSYTPDDLFGE